MFANAQVLLDELNNNSDGIPPNSTVLSFSHFSFGHNVAPNGAQSLFFFDVPDLVVSRNALPASAKVASDPKNPAMPIRFFIYSKDDAYNSVTSLLHTAYATRANVSVIFKNPVANLLKNEREYLLDPSTQYCYVNYYNGKPFSIHCPIMALTLGSN